MKGLKRTATRRRLLWVVLGSAMVVSAGALIGVFSTAPPTIEASPAMGEDDHDHAGHDHPATLGPDGRFTGPGEVWPPQVRGASDVVALDFGEAEAPTTERTLNAADAAAVLRAEGGRALEVALAAPEVADAIGDRFTVVSVTEHEVVPGSVKGALDAEASLVLLYSHDRRSTVEVYVDRDRLVEIVSHPASEEQPPLVVDEKHRAAELARAYWEEVGDDRIDLLEGFVILAVQPGGAYYDTRMAYVSFHLDNTSRPELLTWVDLGTETVLQAKVDR